MDPTDLSDFAPPTESSGGSATASSASVPWKDARFQPAIDSVRAACGMSSADREDDPMIGMYAKCRGPLCTAPRGPLSRSRAALGV